MNIVWLTPEIPYPPIGGRNGVYHRIIQLSKYNTIYLFSIVYTEKEKLLGEEMKKYCKCVHYYNRNKQFLFTLIKSIVNPYSVASRTRYELKRDLKRLLKKENIDIFIVDFPNMAKNLMGIVDSRYYCTLNQHNIEFRRMRNMSEVKTLPIYKRLAYYLESIRLESYENKIYNSDIFKSITFFSKDDMILFKKRWPNSNAKLKVIPLGANNNLNIIEKAFTHNLLFVGRLDDIAIPNVEAVLWFVKQVFPIIRNNVHDAKVIIAGANPSDKITALQNEFVKIIPNYKNFEDVYSLSDIVILPLLSGGGVKGKLLEAASFRKIIISTDHGIEGTDFEAGKHVLLGNTVHEFAQKCISVLNNITDNYIIADNAYSLFSKKYDWNMIGLTYNEFLKCQI